MFHQHIPRPDPMVNPDTQARWKALDGRGVPTYVLNGKKDGGGGTREMAEAIFDKRIDLAIENGLGEQPGAQLQLTAAQAGKIVKASAEAGAIAKPSPDLKLHFLLLEKLVTYSGENGIRFHPNVVRRVATQPLSGAGKIEQTFDVAEAAEKAKEHIDAFEKKDERHNPNGDFRFMQRRDAIDPGNLAVAAFIEDEKTREVYQAAWFDLAPARGRDHK
jgi:hypothetical protein